jgi:spore germination protein YaaH
LTTVYYFAIDLNADGSFNTSDPGISRLQSPNAHLLKDKVIRQGSKWGVTIINLSADSIAKNINNTTRQQTIIDNTIKLMKANQFTALNIDLEYVGDSDPSLTKSFTSFVEKFTTRVHQEIPNSTVSFDAFADSVKKPRIFDMKSLGKILDHVIIMAYDFHRINSIRAGPVAPLFGRDKYEYDISTSVSDYLTKVPPEKILLGVPFYGYEWPTLNNEKGSFTIKSPHGPEISSYRRSIETAFQNKSSINFDDISKSVWFSYFDKDNQTWRQVWFENERSLGLKFDLVNQANLAGIAIFALGYDGSSAKPLWDEVKLKLK